jgi:glycosyltransferase involved in cell wall biosynthesis
VLVDLSPGRAAALMAEAGIYLHTHGTEAPIGMPISIAEAMATGCFVIARDLPGIADYLGSNGARYDGETVEERAAAAAGIIHDTTRWSDDEWHRRWMATVDDAYRRFPNTVVAESMVRAWKAVAPELPVS